MLKDSRGNPSKTLTFVTLAFIVGTCAFIYTTYLSGTADLIGYGAFLSGSLFPFIVREYTEKVKAEK